MLPGQYLGFVLLLLEIQLFHEFELLLGHAGYVFGGCEDSVLRCEIFFDDWVQRRNICCVIIESTIEESLVEILTSWVESGLYLHFFLVIIIGLVIEHHLVDQTTHYFLLSLCGLFQRVEWIIPHVLDCRKLDQVKHLSVS